MLVKAEVASNIGDEVWRVEVVSIIGVLVVKAVVSNAGASKEGLVWVTEEKSNPVVASEVGVVSMRGELVANEDKSTFWVVVVKSYPVVPVVLVVAWGKKKIRWGG